MTQGAMEGRALRRGPVTRLHAVLAIVGLVLAGCQGAGQTSGQLTGQASARSVSQPAAAAVTREALAPLPGTDLSYASVTQAPPRSEPGTAVARAHSAIVIDAVSGRVLHEEEADGLRYPASLTKMMTLYLLFDALDRGEVNMDTPIPVSARAARQPPARIGLVAGESLSVRQAISALAVKSANDVAVAVAEKLGGSESAFAARMTARARSLGMSRTTFVNASGLPDARQVTTARDMAILARALKSRHARQARFFTARSFTYKGRTFKATNNLLGRVAGVDGLKTGYISMSGYNLAATAGRGGRRVIAVVIGGKSESARDREVETLIDTYL